MYNLNWIELLMGIVLTNIPAYLIAYYFYRKQKLQKILSKKIISITSLISKNGSTNELDIFYHGEKLNNPNVILIKFINNGNIPIQSSDFVKPIIISFNDINKIISSEITDLTTTQTDSEVIIKPLLINIGEYFIVKIIVDGVLYQTNFNTRIVGIKSISEYKETQPPFFSIVSIILAISISFVYYGLHLITLNLPNIKWINPNLLSYIIFGAYGLIIGILFSFLIYFFKKTN